MSKKNIVVFTGAGMSAESGLKTFRDSDGLWENHHVEDVATPAGWHKNPELVLRFYNERRKQLLEAKPNNGHAALVDLENKFNVQIITQNVDDLHERAGSKKVLHLHGELRKVRSTKFPNLIYPWDKDLKLGDLCTKGAQLRPHIVWFGESVPMLELASEVASQADIFIIVGSSLQVYPAASLMLYAKSDIPFFYIDPRPQLNWELKQMPKLTVLAESATVGLEKIVQSLLKNEL